VIGDGGDVGGMAYEAMTMPAQSPHSRRSRHPQRQRHTSRTAATADVGLLSRASVAGGLPSRARAPPPATGAPPLPKFMYDKARLTEE